MNDQIQAIFAPGDLPYGSRLVDCSSTQGQVDALLRLVRPDVSIRSAGTFSDGELALITDPNWKKTLEGLEPPGSARVSPTVLVWPKIHTAYYDYWSAPIELVKRHPRLGLTLEEGDFWGYVTSFGSFFGEKDHHGYKVQPVRYRTFDSKWHEYQEQKAFVLSRLGDEESRRDFEIAVDGGPSASAARWIAALYNGLEYMDYARVLPGDTVLNCGVHGGGECVYFAAAMKGVGRIVNVDPLGQQYMDPIVLDSVKSSGVDLIEVEAALDNTNGFIDLPVEAGGMAAGNRAGEIVEGSPTSRFRSARLDDIVADAMLDRVDLIKMDIEGAEPKALQGSLSTIQKFRPKLAISIYHEPRHFFDIPIHLMTVLENYKFFVRSYHFISNEVILYAVPAEQSARARVNLVDVTLI